MRVLFVATALDKPEAYTIRGLMERGFEIKLLISQDSGARSVFGASTPFLDRVPLKSRIDFRSIRKIRTTLKTFLPDIVHSLSGRALSNSLFASIGISLKHVAYRGTMGNLSYWDPSSLICFLHPRVDKLVCVSDAVANDVIRIGVQAHKVIRIYKGHDPAWYLGIQPIAREAISIGVNEYVVCCVANYRPVKGVDVLIRAFQLIPKEIPLRLVIVGEMKDRQLQRVAEQDRRISLLGFRSDASAIVAASDLFCMPSRRREGFPKALIEAMIQSKPAVVTSVGGLPEMVINGYNGLVVPPEDEYQLAAAIMQIAQDRELTLKYGENARAHVLKNFTIANTIEQTAGLYQKLLSSQEI